jgi:hypothetical protein
LTRPSVVFVAADPCASGTDTGQPKGTVAPRKAGPTRSRRTRVSGGANDGAARRSRPALRSRANSSWQRVARAAGADGRAEGRGRRKAPAEAARSAALDPIERDSEIRVDQCRVDQCTRSTHTGSTNAAPRQRGVPPMNRYWPGQRRTGSRAGGRRLVFGCLGMAVALPSGYGRFSGVD